ncbi:MAG: glycosyltransferase, partial [Lachnospiraceae bacterium]|nr:glycosyltransferase [Lachnospiraceae bacterium]
RNKILETGLIKEEDIRKINHLSLMSEDETFLEKERLFSKYNIPTDAFIVASFGYIAETKLNREVCEAVKKLAASGVGKICYVMAGDGEYVDDELQRDVVIKTGYTNLDDFNSFIKHSDIIVNLRNPSMGETSGAMIRILQTGKVCITNSGGWFSELPDDCVVKIGLDNVVDNLTETIKDFIEHPEKKTEMEKNATDYIKREYSPEVIVEKIKEFI